MGGEGIGMYLTADYVQTTDNIWTLNPTSQTGTDITIEMNNEWGFHPDVPSTLFMQINGSTPPNSSTSEDGEFIIVFAVNDTQYFSVNIELEKGQAWQSYPSWESQPLGINDSVFHNIILPDEPIRWRRVSHNDQWDQIGPGSWYFTWE